ncbi:MAG: SPOR domain-containing protein [Bacteroidales bacterium]
MDIPIIIREILAKREGLVIPGLGSLIARYQPAEIDTQKKVIQPPKKEVRFNPNITNDNDQILAKYIASRENITLNLAQTLIQNFVQNTRNKLAQKGSFTLEGIGTLKKEENGNIELVPEGGLLLNLGFEEMQAEPFEPEKPPRVKKESGHSPPPPPPPLKYRRKSIIWIAVSLFLLVIIAGGYYTGFFDYLNYKIENMEIFQKISETGPGEENMEEPPARIEDTIKDTSSVSREIKQTVNQMTDKKRALMYKEPEEETKTYHIIAGSFQVRSNAREYTNQLTEKGFTPKILEHNSLFRISVKSFADKEDALVELYRMRDSGKLKSIWLLGVQEKDR